MRGSRDYQPAGVSANGKVYDEVFVRRVHQLIAMGYDAMLKTSDFSDSAEEDITGELRDRIEEIFDRKSAPQWMDKFNIHNEDPVRGSKRKGKKRPRLDIHFCSSYTRPRTRMCFEAKRLGPLHDSANYLGNEGLGRFVGCKYAKDDNVAGMLGYVQSDDPAGWADKIELALKQKAKILCVANKGHWCKRKVVVELPWTYWSRHDRRSTGSIEILHTLLPFN